MKLKGRSGWFKGLSRYYGSAGWFRRRRRVLRRARWKCERCGMGGVELHVHHLTYERLRRERVGDLVCLCRVCHEGVHGREL